MSTIKDKEKEDEKKAANPNADLIDPTGQMFIAVFASSFLSVVIVVGLIYKVFRPC